MMKSVIVWIYVTYLCSLLQPFCTGTTYTSKACYGSDPLCTRHHLSCNSTQKIGIHDAYYTNNSDCTVEGISSCVNFSADGVTECGYHRFNNTELVSLYQYCSAKVQCVYRAPRRSAALTFSVVKYQCIEGPLLNVNGAAEMKVSQVSLIYEDKARHSPTVIRSDGFVCNFTSSVSVSKMSVYLLDSRLGRTQGQCLADLSVLRGNYITTNNFSEPFTPFKRLNVTWSSGLQQIFFKDSQSLSTGIIWLLINASDPFNVKCETLDRTTAEKIPESPKITSTHNSLAPGTTDNNNTVAGEITTRPIKDELPKSTPSFPAGVFMGGMAAGTVIVILVGLAVFVLVIRRRYDLTAKKKGETPASVEHPTYSGLSAGTDANNYSMIEQTSRSQENTTHGPTGTTDYQNI